MIEEINKKFGGIDLVLSKAAQANPLVDNQTAMRDTEDVVKSIKEEHKEAEELVDKPETLVKQKLIGALPKGGQSNIRQLLRQTRSEIKQLKRGRD